MEEAEKRPGLQQELQKGKDALCSLLLPPAPRTLLGIHWALKTLVE